MGNSLTNVVINSTAFTGLANTANNSSYLGGVVSTSYQLNSTLAANVATMAANNSSYLGGVVSTSYQLNSTLAANVATMTANNAAYLGGIAAASYQTTTSAYNSGYISTLPGTGTVTFTHNLGIIPTRVQILFKCLTAEAEYSVGDNLINPITLSTSYPIWMVTSNTTVLTWTISTAIGYYVLYKTSGSGTTLTPANWAYCFIIAP